ncbi:MAG: hypothetical protein QXL51_03390, partial [Candidatus Aenigmatarchaeota archaeon]
MAKRSNNEEKIWKEIEEAIKEVSEKEEVKEEEEEIKIILPEPEIKEEIKKEEIEKKESRLYYIIYDENILLDSLIDILKNGGFIIIDVPQKIDVENFKDFLLRLKDSIDEIGGDIGW